MTETEREKYRDKQTDKQTDKHTYIHTCIHKYIRTRYWCDCSNQQVNTRRKLYQGLVGMAGQGKKDQQATGKGRDRIILITPEEIIKSTKATWYIRKSLLSEDSSLSEVVSVVSVGGID